MCRSSRREHPKMGPTPKNRSSSSNNNSYANRLDDFRQALKPYRDNNANCLRLITRSARVNLNKHWKSLENLFAAGHDRRADGVKERAQNAANEMLENGENARPAAHFYGPAAADAVDELRRLHIVDDDRR